MVGASCAIVLGLLCTIFSWWHNWLALVPLFWACCAQYLVVAQVAQLATTTCATNFVLPVSGTICTTSAKDIIYIISLALVVQIVPLTGKMILVA